MFVALLVLACTPEKSAKPGSEAAVTDDSGDDTAVKPPDIVLGDPYVGITTSTSAGSLRSDCRVSMAVRENASGEEVASLSMQSQGMDWRGTALTGGTQYKAVATVTDCVNLPDPEPFESGTFSGQEGIFIVLWTTGTNIGYASLTQGDEGGDFTGGEASVTFVDSTPDSYVQAQASAWGVEATNTTGTTYILTFDEKIPVGQILATASADPDYKEGSPVWISKPSWWPSS